MCLFGNAELALHPGVEVADDEIIAHTRTQIAAYKAPKRILRVDDFLRSPNGKSDYKWAKSTAEELAGL